MGRTRLGLLEAIEAIEAAAEDEAGSLEKEAEAGGGRWGKTY